MTPAGFAAAGRLRPGSRRAARARALRALVTALALVPALFGAGCSSYTTRLRELRPEVERGEFEQALARIEKVGRPGDLLYHLERGALLHYLGRHAESNEELETAALRLEELYTISLSQRGLTLLLNDEVEEYHGEVHEGSYLHYLRILNYLALGQHAAATIEARRLELRLAMLAETEADRPAARRDPFLHYLCGALLADAGEWNAALIALRLAREGWAESGEACGSAAPDWLTEDLLRAAARCGIAPGEIGLEQEAADAGPVTPREGREGELLLLVESGWAPARSSEHLRLPVFRTDPDWRGDGGAERGAVTLAERVRYRRLHGHWSPEPVEVAYFLDVALPVLAPRGPEASDCRLRVRPVGEVPGAPPSEATEWTLQIDAATPPASDLACRVEADFAAAEFGVIAKAIGRALLKYFAAAQAERQGGRLAGILVNVAGVATEKADTRGWLMLPASIRAGRMRLPAGAYRIEIEARDGQGRLLRREVSEIEIVADRLAVLPWRPFGG